jgi:hypothetical protein
MTAVGPTRKRLLLAGSPLIAGALGLQAAVLNASTEHEFDGAFAALLQLQPVRSSLARTSASRHPYSRVSFLANR